MPSPRIKGTSLFIIETKMGGQYKSPASHISKMKKKTVYRAIEHMLSSLGRSKSPFASNLIGSRKVMLLTGQSEG